ncbi:NAD-dependent epimerase/dehydratase family protein [Streptomyces sp. WMMC897]|uniref:NAD-dependent epimerase/dehydratase family protein n=1 Tax=Streptomyces sp. WMMC897 TaxID=3014782 RepID=UPI0022B71C90|nr:NAD-dependent epimerase/dehydratase [Streptomyces sp. WMMC897]MCZ7417059.1 NAD-dependent epimerase/dehydratase [Streptomyces sp. WMMC897]
MTPPLVAVLGAGGLLGSAVTALLARRPGRVRAVSRRPLAMPPDALAPVGALADVETLTADLTEPGALGAALTGADAVVYLLTHRTPEGSWRVDPHDAHARHVNLGLLADTLTAPRCGAPRRTVVFASSLGARPDGTAYERYKLAAEDALLRASGEGVVSGVPVRLPTVFGPPAAPSAVDHGVVSAMTRRALAGKPLTLWHDGTVRRDFLYVDDAARALVAALDHAPRLGGRAWPVGSGTPTEVGTVFTAVAELVARHTGTVPVPVHTAAPADPAAADLRDVTAHDPRFRTITGWHPRVPLPTALERTVAALARPHHERTPL